MTQYGAVALAIPCKCREAPAEPYEAAPRPVPAAPPAALPRTEEAARRADALARSLCAARERLAASLACLAASLVRERAWCLFGFARAGDFARERLGRSGRWLRDLATLHEGLARLDGLAAALAGDDGGDPLGRRRALLVARVATDPTLSSWIAQARQLTVRELQTVVAEALAASAPAAATSTAAASASAPATSTAVASASALPVADSGQPATEPSPSPAEPSPSPAPDDPDEDEDRTLVTLAAPLSVAAAFDEAVDLYRAVEGGEATVASFVDALVAEASAAGAPEDGAAGPPAFSGPADAHRSSAGRGPSPSLIERSLARSTDRWRHLPRSADPSWGLALGRSTLARLAAITRAGDSGTCAGRVARLQELLAIEDGIEGHLGRLLATMGEQDAWNRLRFAGLAHYAQERLGLSRTAALSRARAARLAGRFPWLRSAYESNEIGLEATLLVGRLLSAAESTPEQPWVRHAAEITFKRLRDEVRALDRLRAFAVDVADGAASSTASPVASSPAASPSPDDAAPAMSSAAVRLAAPLSDAEWHRSIRRERGTARRRVAALGFIALGARPVASSPFDPTTGLIPEPDVFLRLTLPEDLAGRFLDAIETARQNLSAEADATPWDADWPSHIGEPSRLTAPSCYLAPSRLAARTFSIRARRLPSWVGLLALIEDFVATWDPDEAACGASDDPILARDGWRCMAPGCTSRANLELHHVIYRSRGGGDEGWNLVTLCRFHHQRGEHGDLAHVAGRAPLDLIWRLGSAAGGWGDDGRGDDGGGDYGRGGDGCGDDGRPAAPAPNESNGPPPGPPAPTAAWYRNERRIAPPCAATGDAPAASPPPQGAGGFRRPAPPSPAGSRP